MCQEKEQVRLRTHEEIAAKISHLVAFQDELGALDCRHTWAGIAIQALEWMLLLRSDIFCE